jgi:hypothetical protein
MQALLASQDIGSQAIYKIAQDRDEENSNVESQERATRPLRAVCLCAFVKSEPSKCLSRAPKPGKEKMLDTRGSESTHNKSIRSSTSTNYESTLLKYHKFHLGAQVTFGDASNNLVQ